MPVAACTSEVKSLENAAFRMLSVSKAIPMYLLQTYFGEFFADGSQSFLTSLFGCNGALHTTCEKAWHAHCCVRNIANALAC